MTNWIDRILAAVTGVSTRIPPPPLIIPLDMLETDITAAAGDVTFASRTITNTELFNGKNGSSGEIDRIDLIAAICFKDDSGAQNYLECSNVTFNQWQINIGAGGADDCPFAMHGGLTGQHVALDFEVEANGAGDAVLVADISDLTSSTMKSDADTSVVLTLQNAEALGANLRTRVSTFVKIYYNGLA